ncbi:EpsI family protein [Geomonas sp. RF6]|uniref:exosortase C-terminal domain/associated protein EpsI n=1 Tax=Geomonas sp. RF6 TaxID=2897342 RepID=UPI001E652017|nr:exosortase C-terminal domain/associated protein EpsI [Geomonas sp. RF6]UFS69153.1 EpsI family protein [Geomonas sp. RF6]
MIGKSRFLAVYALLGAAALYMTVHRDLGVPMKKPFEDFPAAVSSWKLTRESSLPESVQQVLKASDVLYREYVNPRGERVLLYVGYHDGGKESGEIHSPKHCLPGSGWCEVYSKRAEVATAGEKLKFVRALYQKGENKELFLYWFQVGKTSISDEYSLKVAEIANSVLHRRRDASFIRISVPVEGDDQKAALVGEQFVKDLIPTLREFLPS